MCTALDESPFQYSSGFFIANSRAYCQKKTQLQKHLVKKNILLTKMDYKEVHVFRRTTSLPSEIYNRYLKDYHVYIAMFIVGKKQ